MVYHTKWDPYNVSLCLTIAQNRLRRGYSGELEYAYRFTDVSYAAPCDQDGDPIPGGGTLQVELQAFHVYKRTPKGFWICEFPRIEGHITTKGRFVLLGATKQYACLTLEEAKQSFLARKIRQRAIYLARADRANKAIQMLHGFKGNFI